MQSLKLLFHANTNPPVPETNTNEPQFIFCFCYEGSVMPGKAWEGYAWETILFLFCLIHHHRRKNQL